MTARPTYPTSPPSSTSWQDKNRCYKYDNNGSLLYDVNRGIALIDYDDRGKPVRIQFMDGSVTDYVYAADGRRLRTRHQTAVEGLTVSVNTSHELTASETLSKDSTDYIGNFRLNGNTLMRYEFGGGYATYLPNATFQGFHFYVRNHQDSVVAVIGDGSADQRTRYYPFGGLFVSECDGEDVNQNKFNGKEHDRMHGLDWYDYGARQYDPVYNRFNSMDPLCERYPHLSPYAYCGNDPVNAIDINGDCIIYRIPNIQSSTFDNYYWNVSSSCFLDSNGNPFSGSDNMMSSIQEALIKLQEGENGRELVTSLSLSEDKVLIERTGGDNHEVPGSEGFVSVVRWNPNLNAAFGGDNFISLAHELAHPKDRISRTFNNSKWYEIENENGGYNKIPKAEIYALHYENLIRAEHGLDLRPCYSLDAYRRPHGGWVIKNDNQAIYFDIYGNHNNNYEKIYKNNYIYRKKRTKF